MADINRRWLIRRRPVGLPSESDFELVREPVPELPDGALLVQNHYCSLDPAIRGWLKDAPSYMPPIALDDAIRVVSIGRVAASRQEDFKVGDWVFGVMAIEDYSIVRPDGFLRIIDPSRVTSITRYLSVLGPVGVTAYCGLLEVACPRAGDTVLVSAAAGASGSIVGQIAKIKGCRTIGIAGGQVKCRRLVERYRFDVAIDYKDKTLEELSESIRAVAPDGVDIVFEHVGGIVLDAALMNLKLHARVALSGLISEYNSTSGPVGARNLWQLIVKRASIRGLYTGDFLDRFGQAQEELAGWLQQGLLVVDEQVEIGIENAIPVFLRLFSGAHDGKLILQLR